MCGASKLGCRYAGLVFAMALIGGAAARDARAQQQPAPEYYNVDKCIPPVNKWYRTRDGQNQLRRAHQKWGSKVFEHVIHKKFSTCQPPPQRGMPPTQHQFNSRVDGIFSPDDGISFVPISAPAQCLARVTYNRTEGDVDYYDNEMVAIDVDSLPSGMRVRQDPVRRSLGMTTMRPATGGGWWISSFFDVFTQLSEDGGLTWTPSTDSTGVPLAAHMVMESEDLLGVNPQSARAEFLYVPNPLQWGGPIRFAVARPGPVRLEVFDAMGRRVVTVAEGETDGERRVNWNGQDQSGRALGPGVYLFRLVTQQGTQTARVVYTR